jgi:hypothetical protein
MARYDERGGTGFGADDNRERWRDDDRERSSWRSGSQGTGEREDERGFFQRAGDEIRSWFNDEEDERRMGRDYERGDFGRTSWERDQYGRSGYPRGESSHDRDFRGGFSDRDRERSYGRIGRGGSDYMSPDRGRFGGMAESGQFGRPSSNWDRDRERGFGPSRGGYRSESNDRDRDRFGSSKRDFGGFRDEGDFRSHRRDHPQSWGEANRSENESLGYGDFSGTLGGFGNQTFGSSQDDHYRSWRDRQMSQLDRDYADYCREREQQFNQDFDSWRRNRQSQSPSGDLGGASNAGVGTTTSSMTGTAGAGSEAGSATTQSGSMQTGKTVSTEAADAGTGTSRSGSRPRS